MPHQVVASIKLHERIEYELMPYVFLALTIVLIASGQIAQKFASRHVRYGARLPRILIDLGCTPSFWVAILCMGAGLIVWLMTLSAVEVSKAYPVLALSFVITAILSQIVLKENVSPRRWVGIVLVTSGAVFMLLAK